MYSKYAFRYGFTLLRRIQIGLTILTIDIELSLIRVFQRTSQTDVNTNTSNIYMYSYISINIGFT